MTTAKNVGQNLKSLFMINLNTSWAVEIRENFEDDLRRLSVNKNPYISDISKLIKLSCKYIICASLLFNRNHKECIDLEPHTYSNEVPY